MGAMPDTAATVAALSLLTGNCCHCSSSKAQHSGTLACRVPAHAAAIRSGCRGSQDVHMGRVAHLPSLNATPCHCHCKGTCLAWRHMLCMLQARAGREYC